MEREIMKEPAMLSADDLRHEEKPAHLHLAFTAENRRQVEAFYRAAMEAGGVCGFFTVFSTVG
jgi:hypothetical protein